MSPDRSSSLSVPAISRRWVGVLLAVLCAAAWLVAGAGASPAAAQPTGFTPIGADIDGEAAGDWSGYSVAASADGTTLAIGAILNDDSGNDAGQVRVHAWDGTNWVQQGADINGEAAGDLSGLSLALSADGTTLAIGANGNDGTGSFAGHVRVYTWDGTDWVQQGADINGETAADQSGASVVMSADGTTLAIGAILNDGNGSNAGQVRVYTWNGTNWVQQGADINGETAGDESGRSVALSADGTTMAIGSPFNDGNGNDAGQVRVHTWDGTNWVQQGADINGEAAGDRSGWSVALSADGTTLAIGAPRNAGTGSNEGHVRVHTWDGTNWVQQGADINGEAAYDNSGWSVALSADGTTLAIGAHGNDGNGSNAGHVRVHTWDGTNWVQQGADINGEAAGDQSGWSVALSADGTTLAIGALRNDGNGSDAGHVRAYALDFVAPSVTVEQAAGQADPATADPVRFDVVFSEPVTGLNAADVVVTGTAPGAAVTVSGSADVYVVSVSVASGGTVTVDLPAGAAEDGAGNPSLASTFTDNTVTLDRPAIVGFTTIGADIDGEAAFDQSGWSVALSADGTTMAIGAIRNDDSGSLAGQVRVHTWSGTNWVQQGADINGEAAGDLSGYSVALSADGTTLAIGAPYNDGNGTNAGHVRVHTWDGTNWVQQGADINGEAAGDLSGLSLALSADGTTLAIGAPFNNGNGSYAGHVRVHTWNGTNWVHQGADINGEAAYDNSGRSVALSADGTTLAVGAIGNDAGHVRVHTWDGTNWVQQGADINGEAAADRSGHSVALSADGTTLAIGAYLNDGNGTDAGHVRVHTWNGTNWVQQGADINGETAFDQSGRSVALSADGTTLAVGAIGNDGNGSVAGQVRVHTWDGTNWVQQGADINGETANDQSGWSVALSADGTTLAIGAPYNDGNGSDAGHVRAYQVDDVVAPSVTVEQAAGQADPATTDPVRFDVVFSEPVTGLNAADVVVTGTALGATVTVSGSADVYVVSVSVASGGTVTVDLPAGAAEDGAGNPSLASTSTDNTVTLDRPAIVGFTTIGADIDGEAAFDQSGWLVALSADGTTMAIGARLNDDSGNDAGQVRVYTWDGTNWVQQGADINGEAAGDQSGWSVALSADGTTLAIGAPYNDGNGTDAGQVRVHTWDGTNWVQQGTDINGEAANDLSGHSVALSADGTTLAIGAHLNDGTDSSAGHVRVHAWDGTNWVQQGADINGEAAADLSGRSVALSADGTTLAIGAILNDGNGTSAGHVRVHTWNGTNWVQQGADINGEAAFDNSGWSVALSADGTTLAIGAHLNDDSGSNAGQVRVYTWDGTNWVQQGGDINGEAANDLSGLSVALSADGTTLAIGALRNDGNGTDAGQVRVHTWNGTNWVQQGADINGETAGDESGRSVALSADGTTLAIGAPHNAGTGTNAGHVRAYQVDDVVAPSVTVEQAAGQADPATTDPVRFDVVFSEPVTGLNAADVVVTGTALGATVTLSGSADVYVVSVSVASGGTVTVDLPAGAAEDGAGNPSQASTSTDNTVTLDRPAIVGFTTIGADIDGEAAFDQSGWSVALSADGTTMAIGAPYNDDSGNDAGQVRVHTWDGTNWVQQGADINGEAANDLSGLSVALSADGTTLAIGARYNDGNGTNAGHVRVYAWDGTNWIQQGADINGEATFDLSGVSVALSADGTTLAIGANGNDGTDTGAGHVRVYAWGGTNWVQQGADIDGEAAFDQSGYSVALSADGTTLAVGAFGKDGNGSDAGQVRVHTWDGTSWVQQGADINGEAAGDQSGWSVALSADGTTLAIGAVLNDGTSSNAGHVRVHTWDGGNWVQQGADINGEAANDNSGYSVALSADGTTLAVGAPFNDGTDSAAGHVRVHTWDGTNWVQQGADINGEAANDLSGQSVALSADGTTLAISAPYNDGNGTDAGHVRAYRIDDVVAPSVTVEQAAGQADPAAADPVRFDVVFSEPVTGLEAADVVLSGSAGATTVVVTGSDAIYELSVSGTTSGGTVIADLPAGAAEDGAGNPSLASTSADNTVTLDSPAVAEDDEATVDEDSADTSIDVLANDNDPDGDAFVIDSVTDADHGTANPTPDFLAVSYTPGPGFCGPDSFDYTITGGSTATVTMTVTCVNDIPSVTVDGPHTVTAGDSITLTAAGTDPDGDTLSYAWDLDDNGTFETVGDTPGATTIIYDAAQSYATIGDHTVTVQVSDPDGATDTAQATVTVQTRLELRILTPTADGLVTTGDTASAMGFATGGIDTVDLIFNGGPPITTSPNPSNRWTADLGWFADGDNTLTVTANATDGRTISQTIRIFATASPDAITCDGVPATIVGSDTADTLTGTDGPDVIVAGDGDDTINGLDGDDLICGGPGNDTINAGLGHDTVYGQSGDDAIDGDGGHDILFGNDGADTIIGGNGDDEIRGGHDDDTLDGGFGRDQIDGGSGTDIINGGIGADQLNGGDGNDTLNGGAGRDRLSGDAGDDTLNGDSGHDALYGDDGNDTLNGGDGNDRLYGGPGTDACNGNTGTNATAQCEP